MLITYMDEAVQAGRVVVMDEGGNLDGRLSAEGLQRCGVF